MKVLKNAYFTVFPLVFIPLMYLLYDGNIFLYNVFAMVILFILIINRMILKSDEVSETPMFESYQLKSFNNYRYVSIFFFVMMYFFLFFKFVLEEVLPGLGSV